MQYQIFDDMAQSTDDTVARLLPLVSPQRRAYALKYHFTAGRFASLKSYLMLHDILVESNLIPQDEPLLFAYNDHGKPYLKDHPDIHFNISHCPAAIAVAVSDHPIGIDIECFHTPDDALLRHTMNDDEIHRILSSPNPVETFTTLWTQKEALLKCLGTGIISDLRSVLETATAIQFNGPGATIQINGTACRDARPCVSLSSLPCVSPPSQPCVSQSHINPQKQYIYTICENFPKKQPSSQK